MSAFEFKIWFSDFWKNQKQLDPEYIRILNENFYDLLA